MRNIAEIKAPPEVGGVVSSAWDFQATATPEPGEEGRFEIEESVTRTATVRLEPTHTFDRLGTFFPALRVHWQRQEYPHTSFARVANLGRERITVS